MGDSERRPLLESDTSSYDTLHDPNLNFPPDELHSGFQSTLSGSSTHGKTLTWSSAYILVVSRVIGSGVFATPGSIVKSTGSIGLTLVVWLVGTVLAACGMALSMEYGCMLPRSGGEKVYLEYAYPHPRFLASTLIAVQAVLLGFTASNCIIFAKYTLFAFNVEPTEYQHKLLAVGLLTLITIIHGCFLRTGIWVQNILGWVKIVLIAAFSLISIWTILVRPYDEPVGASDQANPNAPFAWDTLWEGSNWSWSLLSTSLFKVFYSYAGLNNVNNVLSEVKNPVQTVKTVCPAALFTAGGLYFLANISYFLVVPLEEIKNSGELVAGLLFERLFGAHVGRVLFPLAIAISAAGNVMVVTFALARVNQEIARQGFLPWPRVLSSSRPFNSPLGGLIVHYVPSVLVISLPPQGDVYNFILDVEGYPSQMFALAVTIGLIIVRRREPFLNRPFKAWNGAIWLRIVVCLALLAAPFFPPPGRKGDVHFFYATYAIVGSGVVLFGVLYWYVWTVWLPRRGNYALVEEKDPRHVQTTLHFLKEFDDGSHLAPTYVGQPETYNRPTLEVPVTIHDVSGRELDYTLDQNGFQFYYHTSKEKDFLDDEKIKNEYYPETEQLLKDATGASRVFIFDHTIRRQSKDDRTPSAALRGPVQRVHIDQSYEASASRVSHHLPEDAPELLKGRFEIINVWRPIKTILKDPLTVGDAHTLPDSDLIPIKLIYPNREGETYSVRSNPNVKWYYRYGQTPDLVTLIKCFDSKTDGRARRVPHSAFTNPATENEAPRESIEVRALVFHPEDRD
ncbi:amino acid permease-domain-containing protein [Aspergillus avenaceus]|uniref:Amino acid permease-domain-containing protein n=1 Tax=Aspergillus avenaceus TaxID=36643 RepID=A0A5N6U3K1_ASPAV|nr:amino acid permease-domain-containing protein [Aspergillus avenaceus]